MQDRYERRSLLEKDEKGSQVSILPESKGAKRFKNVSSISVGLLILSVCVNILFLSTLARKEESVEFEISEFAGLQRNISREWWHRTPYTGGEINDTDADVLWDAISVSEGAVALTRDYVQQHGLPASQGFPWDEEKTVFFINGYHNLHCLKKIRQTLREMQQGMPLTAPLYHSYHCLDALRMEVLCDADDSPRYTGMNQENKASGTGQSRMCKDWSQLERWTTANSACWRYYDEDKAPENHLEQYRFCPEQLKKYNPTIEAWFKGKYLP